MSKWIQHFEGLHGVALVRTCRTNPFFSSMTRPLAHTHTQKHTHSDVWKITLVAIMATNHFHISIILYSDSMYMSWHSHQPAQLPVECVLPDLHIRRWRAWRWCSRQEGCQASDHSSNPVYFLFIKPPKFSHWRDIWQLPSGQQSRAFAKSHFPAMFVDPLYAKFKSLASQVGLDTIPKHQCLAL